MFNLLELTCLILELDSLILELDSLIQDTLDLSLFFLFLVVSRSPTY